jgi:acetylornithine deacetylase
MMAFDAAVQGNHPGSVALALVEGEETTGKGTSATLDFLSANDIPVAAAVVGEPTCLEIAIAQKGLLILELFSEASPCHAARAAQLGVANPIISMARDLIAVDSLEWPEVDPFLGPISLQPTVVRGGSAKNQVPGRAGVVVDIRSTNSYSHSDIVARIQEVVEGHVHILSSRLEPVATSADAEVVVAARSARPGATIFGSATMSDMVFMKGIPAIKIGPGVSERSHTPDEFITVDELQEGAKFYRQLIEEFFRLENPASINTQVTV